MYIIIFATFAPHHRPFAANAPEIAPLFAESSLSSLARAIKASNAEGVAFETSMQKRSREADQP